MYKFVFALLTGFVTVSACYAQNTSCPSGDPNKVVAPLAASAGDDYSHLYTRVTDPNQSYVIFYRGNNYSPQAASTGFPTTPPVYVKELVLKLRDGGCQDIASTHPLHDNMFSMILVAPSNVMLEICDHHTTSGKYSKSKRARFVCRKGEARGFKTANLSELARKVSSIKWYLLKPDGTVDREIAGHTTIHP